jgi:lipoate-protein ligase B
MRVVKIVRFLEPQPYEKILKLQAELVRTVIDGRQGTQGTDFLLLLEHEPVITLGRRSHAQQTIMNRNPIPMFKVRLIYLFVS